MPTRPGRAVRGGRRAQRRRGRRGRPGAGRAVGPQPGPRAAVHVRRAARAGPHLLAGGALARAWRGGAARSDVAARDARPALRRLLPHRPIGRGREQRALPPPVLLAARLHVGRPAPRPRRPRRPVLAQAKRRRHRPSARRRRDRGARRALHQLLPRVHELAPLGGLHDRGRDAAQAPRLGGGGDAPRAVHDPAAVPPLERSRREQAGYRADVVHHQGDQMARSSNLAAAASRSISSSPASSAPTGTTTPSTRMARSSRSSAAARRWPATACGCSRRRGRRSRCSIWTTGPSSCRRPTPPSPTGTSGTSTCRRIAGGVVGDRGPRRSVGRLLCGLGQARLGAVRLPRRRDAFFERFLQRLRKSVEHR